MTGINIMLTAPEYDDYILGPVLEHRAKTLDEGSVVLTAAAVPQVIDEAYWLSQFAEIDALDLGSATEPNRYLTEEPALRCSSGGGWSTCPEFVPADQLIDGLCPTHAQEDALSKSDLDELDAITWHLEDEAEERWREGALS